MAYDNPDRRTFLFANAAFTSALQHEVRLPKAKAVTLVDYGVQDVTAAVTGAGIAQVGNTTTVDAYGKSLSLTGTAVNDGRTVRSQHNDPQEVAPLIPNNGSIPPDTVVRITLSGATAGTGSPYLVLDVAW